MRSGRERGDEELMPHVGGRKSGAAANDLGRLAYTPAEVARACGLSRTAIYRLVESGELRAARVCGGSRLLITAEDVAAECIAVFQGSSCARASGRTRSRKAMTLLGFTHTTTVESRTAPQNPAHSLSEKSQPASHRATADLLLRRSRPRSVASSPPASHRRTS
jgi:excisionase family DNA binding protein